MEEKRFFGLVLLFFGAVTCRIFFLKNKYSGRKRGRMDFGSECEIFVSKKIKKIFKFFLKNEEVVEQEQEIIYSLEVFIKRL